MRQKSLGQFLRNKYCVSRFFFFVLAILLFPYSGFASLSTESQSRITYYDVGGNAENSFYDTESLEYLSELFLDWDEESFGNWGLKASLDLRTTDDRLIDAQSFSVENFFAEITQGGISFAVGDFAADFSSFTINNSLKGLKTSFALGERTKFTAVAGTNFSYWEDIWEERTDDTQSRQYVGGFRLEQTLSHWGNLGINFGASRDDDCFVSTSVDPQSTEVVSFDATLNLFKNLNLEAEIATSWFDENTDSKDTSTKTDHALHLLADYRIGKFLLRGGLERNGSNFSSVSGFSTQDFQEYSQELEVDLFNDIILRLSYRQNRDNLDKHKSTTTIQKSPAVNLSFKPFRNTTADLGCDLTRRDATDDSVEEVDRRAFIRINQEIGPANLALEYQKAKIDNNIDNTPERLSDYVIFGFDTSFSLKNISFSPELEYGINYEEYRSVCESDLTHVLSLGLGLTFPNDWEINSKVSLSRFDGYQADFDQNNKRYELNLIKRFGQNYEFGLNYEHSGYGYETSEENYDETTISLMLNFRF